MTLFKQMALMVSLIIIIMLGSVMYINFESTKRDMITSLYETTVNNISTLTNNLAAAGEDSALITSTIDAEFDSGYYKLIAFQANSGDFQYSQVDKQPIEEVPAWFIKFTNIEIEPTIADVSSGWNIIGEVKVIGDPNIIYKALYKVFVKLLYLFVIFVFISLILLGIILHYVLKPLQLIQKQAEAILKNEFVIQEKEPYTTEFKDVVKGMNAMVHKVEEIFNKANQAATKNRELLYNDPDTKLFNRRYLMLKLPDILHNENSIGGGTLLFIAFNSIETMHTLLGHKQAQSILQEFASLLQKSTELYEEKLLVRVNETEFALVLPACESDVATLVSEKINSGFETISKEHKIDSSKIYINIGLYRYKPSISIPDLLTRTDNALSNAKASEHSNIYLYRDENEENAMGKEQWRNILDDAITNNHFLLKFYSTIDARTKLLKHKVMTFTIDDNKEKHYFYGDFIAPAISLGLVSKTYTVALKKLITIKHNELNDTLCSIRLSNEYIKDEQALNELTLLFKQYAKTLPFRLYFEVSDNFAITNTALVKSFVELFAQYDFGFGINSFSGESNDYAYLKELNPAFIKADVLFLLDQSQEYMSALHVITDSLGVELTASGVATQEQLQRLSDLHINIIQGPITEKL